MGSSGYMEDEDEEMKADLVINGPIVRKKGGIKCRLYKLNNKHKH